MAMRAQGSHCWIKPAVAPGAAARGIRRGLLSFHMLMQNAKTASGAQTARITLIKTSQLEDRLIADRKKANVSPPENTIDTASA